MLTYYRYKALNQTWEITDLSVLQYNYDHKNNRHNLTRTLLCGSWKWKGLVFGLLLGFYWAGGAAPPHAPASFAAGKSLVPVSPAGCLDADVFLFQNVQEKPERTLTYNSEQFW